MAVKNVTIQDIADRLGMAKSTVSKAISGATDISERPVSVCLPAPARWGIR